MCLPQLLTITSGKNDSDLVIFYADAGMRAFRKLLSSDSPELPQASNANVGMLLR